MGKIKLTQAVIVEGRDDVRAVSEVCEALIIPTHGFGISKETWQIAEKAYREKGLIVLTDPDHAGEEIRRRLREKFPEAIQAYVDRSEATSEGDIGIENAGADVIAASIEKALERANRKDEDIRENKVYAEMKDLADLGLAGNEGSAEKRAAVCRRLGIGYGNASAMIKRLKGFGIDIDELKEAVEKCK